MLKWLFSWFGRSESFDLYQPQERLIYRYFTGKEEVQADPLTLWKKMMAVGPELSIDIRVSTSPSKGAAAAHTELLSKIRSIFNVKPFEEGGLSELETVELFNHFLIYCERLKKNTKPFPTSSPSTEESKPSSEEGQATPSSSDSGSTGNAPSIESPTASPSESQPFSEPN